MHVIKVNSVAFVCVVSGTWTFRTIAMYVCDVYDELNGELM